MKLWNMKQKDDELMIQVVCCTIGFLQLTMVEFQFDKLKFSSFQIKVCAHPLFLHFGKFSLPKIMLNGSHVEASLQKVNVIAQVLVHKGPYNVRITTRVKIVSLSLCNYGATCMIHLFIHKRRSTIWTKKNWL
jgi:hypothetical protein